MESTHATKRHEVWNKGKLIGQRAPFKLKEIWVIRVRLEMQGRLRELALFDLGIDSKLRACDGLLPWKRSFAMGGQHSMIRAALFSG